MVFSILLINIIFLYICEEEKKYQHAKTCIFYAIF